VSRKVPLAKAAIELRVGQSTLRHWFNKRSCPGAVSGGHGRGAKTLVDVDVVRRWRDGTKADAALLELAGEIPDLIGTTIEQVFTEVDLRNVAKYKLAGVMAVAAYKATAAVLDRLGAPELANLPDSVKRLRKIATDRAIKVDFDTVCAESEDEVV